MTRHDQPVSQTAEMIAAQLDRDRQSLVDTVERMRNRLSGEKLLGDVMGYATANVGPYARTLDETMRANPAAAIVAGVGLAWLIFGRKNRSVHSASTAQGSGSGSLTRWADDGGPQAPTADDDSRWVHETDMLRNNALHALALIDWEEQNAQRPAAELATDRAKVLAELAISTRNVMLRGLERLTDDARNDVFALREKAYAARHATLRKGSKVIEGSPLLSAAISMAIGAAVAAALPRTQTEDRFFGPERDRLTELAHHAVRQERGHISQTTARLANAVASELRVIARERLGQSA